MLFTGEQRERIWCWKCSWYKCVQTFSPRAWVQPQRERDAGGGVRRSLPHGNRPFLWGLGSIPSLGHPAHPLTLQSPATWPSQNHLTCQDWWGRNQLKPTGGALPPQKWISSLVALLQWIYSVGKIWACVPGYLGRHLYTSFTNVLQTFANLHIYRSFYKILCHYPIPQLLWVRLAFCKIQS